MNALVRMVVAVPVFGSVGFACYLAGAFVLLFITGTGPGAEKTVAWAEPLIIAASGIVAIGCVVVVDRTLCRAAKSN